MPHRENSISLPFPYDALYPAICAPTLEVHCQEIMHAHLDALEVLRASHPELAELSARELLLRRNLPRRDAEAIVWHAGAVYAHGLYFSSLAPPVGGYSRPGQSLTKWLSRDIGSFAEVVYRLREAAVTMRGVGFVYLLRDASGKLVIRSFRDYDCPTLAREKPLFCIDLWEHAYFSDVGPRPERAVDAFLSVLCWEKVERRADS